MIRKKERMGQKTSSSSQQSKAQPQSQQGEFVKSDGRKEGQKVEQEHRRKPLPQLPGQCQRKKILGHIPTGLRKNNPTRSEEITPPTTTAPSFAAPSNTG